MARFVIYIEAWWQCSTHNRCPPETHVFFSGTSNSSPVGNCEVNPSPLDWHPGLLGTPRMPRSSRRARRARKSDIFGLKQPDILCSGFFCNISKPNLQTFQTYSEQFHHNRTKPTGYGLIFQKKDTICSYVKHPTIFFASDLIASLQNTVTSPMWDEIHPLSLMQKRECKKVVERTAAMICDVIPPWLDRWPFWQGKGRFLKT